jgi:hypothetical protein
MNIRYRKVWTISPSTHVFTNYTFVHDDYDGAPDGGDTRCGYGDSVESCMRQIDEWHTRAYFMLKMTKIPEHELELIGQGRGLK